MDYYSKEELLNEETKKCFEKMAPFFVVTKQELEDFIAKSLDENGTHDVLKALATPTGNYDTYRELSYCLKLSVNDKKGCFYVFCNEEFTETGNVSLSYVSGNTAKFPFDDMICKLKEYAKLSKNGDPQISVSAIEKEPTEFRIPYGHKKENEKKEEIQEDFDYSY